MWQVILLVVIASVSSASSVRPLLIRTGEVDVCSLPPVEPGPVCEAFVPKWTFDGVDGICKPYVYGGCKGTANLFDTEADCMRRCSKSAVVADDDIEAADSVCFLDHAVGDCRGSFSRFFYNRESKTCQEFKYTGCKGNGNNFFSLHECQTACKKHIQLFSSTNEEDKRPQICYLPPDDSLERGRACYAYIPSWTFNTSSGRCESYIYGGCGKTKNLFRTESDCKNTCLPAPSAENACLLPVDSGLCYAFSKRYAFVKEKNRCELFTYGGCYGNTNNFATSDECFAACGGELPSLDPDCSVAVCDTRLQKYYFEKGCRAEYRDASCCPSSYICPEESPKKECRYRGVVYQVGDAVDQAAIDDPCRSSCFCKESSDGAYISCVQDTCPQPSSQSDNATCIAIRKANQCCPTFVCDDQSQVNATMCTYEGKDYIKGQTIPGPDPCRSCTCVERFNGLFGPGCRDIHCVMDYRSGCVPVYADGQCCPTDYKCGNNFTVTISGDGDLSTGTGAVESRALSPSSTNDLPLQSDICLLPKVIGICKAYVPSYYYDAQERTCLPFVYGGCKGNANRFSTEVECMKVCAGVEEPSNSVIADVDNALVSARGKKVVKDDKCLLPMEVGVCRASLPSYYYDADKGACVYFIYGGCRGNDNNFATEQECLKACKVDDVQGAAKEKPPPTNGSQSATGAGSVLLKTKKKVKDEKCLLRKETGPCRAKFNSFYYDPERDKCSSFIYGGCGGNANRFPSYATCLKACKVDDPAGGREGGTLRVPAKKREPHCTFHNVTIKVGDKLVMEDPCDTCACVTPPLLTCTRKTCPAFPGLDGAICTEDRIPGECCPVGFSCVSANPPFIDVCADVRCEAGKICEVQSQDSADGSWLPPIGVCVTA